MRLVLPVLALAVAGALAAYHRLPLCVLALLSAALLTGSAFVGANPIALWVAVIGLALITVPLMIGPFRRSRITAPLLRFRSEEHTSELQSLMRISYAVFCLKKKNTNI